MSGLEAAIATQAELDSGRMRVLYATDAEQLLSAISEKLLEAA